MEGAKTNQSICSSTIEGTKTKWSICSSTVEGTKTKRSICSPTIEGAKMKRYLFLNYRRNEDEAKYSFLNYRRNEDEAKYSFLNYQWFAIANCVDKFYPWKDIIGKKVSKLRSIAELRAFYGRFCIIRKPIDKAEHDRRQFDNSTTFLTIDFKLILWFKGKKGNKIKVGRLAWLGRPESEYHWKIQMGGCVIFPINILKLCQIKQPIGSKTIGDKVARNTGL